MDILNESILLKALLCGIATLQSRDTTGCRQLLEVALAAIMSGYRRKGDDSVVVDGRSQNSGATPTDAEQKKPARVDSALAA